jgi:hypothetical protein
LSIWLPTIKSLKLPLIHCVQVSCHIPFERLDKCYNFFFNLTSIDCLHTKLWASKVEGVPILGILGLPFGSFKTKWHLGVGPKVRHKKYYKGEGGGLSKIKAMVNLVNLCSLMVRSCTKKGSNYALTNLLFGLCEFVWVINLLVNLPSPHPKISTHPSTLKMLWPRNVPQLLLPLSSFLDSQLNPSKSLWVGHKQTTKSILKLY